MYLGSTTELVAKLTCRLIPVVGVRLWFLSPSKNIDPNHPVITAGVYTEAALELAFMLSNITCLKPFLRPFHSGYFVSTIDTKNSGYPTTKDSTSRGDTYYMISRAKSTADNKDGSMVQDSEVDGISSQTWSDTERTGKAPAFRPDRTSHRVTVLSNNDGQVVTRDREGSEDMIISKTQAWTVSYEDDQRKNSASTQV